MEDPTLGHVNPLRFIPVAEGTGFIVPLGRWILVEACEQVAAWASCPGAELSLWSICPSANCSRPELVDEVRTALALSGLDPRRLIFDVAENVLLKEPEETIRALAELRAIGTRVAVDDFGAGRSSLSHLRRFPIDILKLDKSFVDPLIDTDATASALVAAIIGLAGQLGLEVVAEGSSTRAKSADCGPGHRARSGFPPRPTARPDPGRGPPHRLARERRGRLIPTGPPAAPGPSSPYTRAQAAGPGSA